jgi:hypothetical protein
MANVLAYIIIGFVVIVILYFAYAYFVGSRALSNNDNSLTSDDKKIEGYYGVVGDIDKDDTSGTIKGDLSLENLSTYDELQHSKLSGYKYYVNNGKCNDLTHLRGPIDGNNVNDSAIGLQRERLGDCTNVFKIKNHLSDYIVRLDLLPFNDTTNRKFSKQYTLIDRINPGKTVALNRDKLMRVMVPGSVLKIYIVTRDNIKDLNNITNNTDVGGKILHYEDVIVKDSEILSGLHIGMVTSRWIQGTQTDDHAVTSSNAVSGRPYVMIHNVSNIPLSLNNRKIQVPPHGVVRYQGQYHFGVALGTHFNDDDGIYKKFQYLFPATDVYFGVISDIDQPAFGGVAFQEFNDLADNIAFPFEQGYI